MKTTTSLILISLLCGPLFGTTYYAAIDGDDGNDGLGPGADRALRTIQEGVNRLRPGDTLLIRGGTYRETITFSRNGEPGRPIVLKPYRDERVLVSGCDPITNWTLVDEDRGMWKAPMSWTLGKGRNQVFAEGELVIEARHPNTPEDELGMYVSDLSPLWPTFAHLSISNPAEHPGRIAGACLEGYPVDHWKGACYYGVHYRGWSAQTGIVETSRDGEIDVVDRTDTWWFGSAYGAGYKPEEGRGMLVGHMNALDQPGEWHWEDSNLYLIPATPGPPVRVEAKARHLAFDLSGCEYLRIEDLDIKAASMRLQHSGHCVVDHCRLSYISHYRRHYGIGQVERGQDTLTSGETGIFVGGHDNTFTSCSVRFSAGAGFYLRGYHHTIHNCLIDEISYTSHYLNAITDAVSDFNDYENFLVGGHVITYNTMRNAGRHFFNIYGNGTSKASRTRGPMDYMATLFAHNHLYNGMLQTRDAGFLTGYYCSGGTLNGLNTQIAYNVMHDCYDIFGMRINVLGIVYLDAGTCDVDLHHNLLWAAPGSHQRGLWFNTMCVDVREYDNVFHPNFERTSSQLTAEDFPENRPFRFGHDVNHAPPAPTWPQLERRIIAADTCTSDADGIEIAADGISGLRNDGWVRLGTIDFDRGWTSAVMEFASSVRALNSDRAGRQAPRHRNATDPLVLEAIRSDGTTEGIRRQWSFMYNTAPGSWIRFNQVPLGNGYRRFRVIYGNDEPAARRLEVRLDKPDGPLVSTVELAQTDVQRGPRVQIYDEAVGEVRADATGTHDVFVVFHSADGKPVGSFEYFRFEQYRGDIPLQPNEVKLELRTGSPAGERIGVFYPRFTGDAAPVREMVATLESPSGQQPLFACVRSAVDGPIGTIRAFRLEKAKRPIDWTGVGEAPRRQAGTMVLPQATHRPCARPADKYPARNAPSVNRAPRVAEAARREAPPVVDGTLDEWRADAATLSLQESWDASETTVPQSPVWIAYDDQALYIAARHLLGDGVEPAVGDHAWGGTDGMEIVLQDAFGQDDAPILNIYGWPDGHMQVTDIAGTPAATVSSLQDAVTYRAVAASGVWTCEWRLPFDACGFSPASAPLVRLNLGVRKVAAGGWAIWCGTGGATYQAEKGGLLAFSSAFGHRDSVPTEGLAVWLDAADSDAVTVDQHGRVETWRDASGNQRHARQKNPAHRPGFLPEGLNKRPALRFDEKRQTRLELPDMSQEKVTATVLAVISNPEPGSEVNHDPRIFTACDGKGYDYQIGIAATVPGMQTGGPRQISATFADRWAKMVRVGCFSPMYQTYFTGTIAEILVYERTLTAAEQARLRAYLALKWGLR